MEIKATLEGPDALDLLRKAPEKLLRLFEGRDAVTVGILATSENALVVEHIRDRYKEKVFRNIAYSLELLNNSSYFIKLLDHVRGARQLDMKALEKEHESFSNYLLPYLNYDLGQKSALLTNLFQHFNPNTRKVSILISNMTLKSMLIEMQSFYKKMLETQQTKDGRAGNAYYLNDSFSNEWKKRASNLEDKINKDPFADFGYKEVAFYGLDERLITTRLEVAEELLSELKAMIAKKAGKEALNKFHEKIKSRYLLMKEMLLMVPGIDQETAELLRKMVNSNTPPEKETLKKWLYK